MNNHVIDHCLSVHQPWAWAICVGTQQVEYCSCATDHRGTIAVRANTNRETVQQILRSESTTDLDEDYFTCGAIIGLAEVVDCIEFNPRQMASDEQSGLISWKLKDAQLLSQPIPIASESPLFDLDGEVVQQLFAQLRMTTPMLDPHEVERVKSVIRPC